VLLAAKDANRTFRVAGFFTTTQRRKMPKVTRRSFIAGATADAATSGLASIQHVIVMMQENRSFDHYFGSLQGVRGFGDRTSISVTRVAGLFLVPPLYRSPGERPAQHHWLTGPGQTSASGGPRVVPRCKSYEAPPRALRGQGPRFL
jgi:phospholipase C